MINAAATSPAILTVGTPPGAGTADASGDGAAFADLLLAGAATPAAGTTTVPGAPVITPAIAFADPASRQALAGDGSVLPVDPAALTLAAVPLATAATLPIAGGGKDTVTTSLAVPGMALDVESPPADPAAVPTVIVDAVLRHAAGAAKGPGTTVASSRSTIASPDARDGGDAERDEAAETPGAAVPLAIDTPLPMPVAPVIVSSAGVAVAPTAVVSSPSAAPVPLGAPLAAPAATAAPAQPQTPADPVPPPVAPLAVPGGEWLPSTDTILSQPAPAQPAPAHSNPAQLVPPVATRAEPAAAPLTGSAAQVFGAAIVAAVRPERVEQIDAGAPLASAVTPIATATAIAATADAQQAPLDLTQQRWPHAMIDRIEQLRDAAGGSEARIRLIPDALGSIDVSVKQDGGVLTVHFAAEQSATRALLQDAQPRLAAAAEERGLRLGQSAVDGDTAGQQQQGRTPAQAQQSRAPARAGTTPTQDNDPAAEGRVA